MIMDIIIGLLALIGAFSGYRKGLVNMLGRLVLILLSLALTLLMLSPFVSWLVQRPLLQPLEERISAPILEPLQETTEGWSEAVLELDLPPALQSLLAQQVPDDETPFAQAYPAFSASIFRFALTAGLFVLVFALIAIGVRLITRSLTRLSDRLILIGWVNRLAGLIVGLVFAAVQILILVFILTYLSMHLDWARDLLTNSRLINWFHASPLFERFF